MDSDLEWKFRVGDRVVRKINPGMTGIVVSRVSGHALGNTARLFPRPSYHVLFDIKSKVQIEERDLVPMDSEPKTTPFEALGWKFQLGDKVGHRSNPYITGLVVGRVAIQTAEIFPGFCRSYHVRTGLVPIVQIEEDGLFRANEDSLSLMANRVEPTGEDSGATAS